MLCAEPFEWVSASESSSLLEIPAELFIHFHKINAQFATYFAKLRGLHEAYRVLKILDELKVFRNEHDIAPSAASAKNTISCAINQGDSFEPPTDTPPNFKWYLSTAGVPDYPVGYQVSPGEVLPRVPSLNLPYRFIGLLPGSLVDDKKSNINSDLLASNNTFEEGPSLSLSQLGILEDDNLQLDERYPFVQGKGGKLNEGMAVCEMIAMEFSVPFRKDTIRKIS